MKNLRFDIQKELKLVGLVSYTPHVLVVRASLPVNTLGDLIALAKQQPGKLTYASSGTGGAIHLASELFKREAGVDLVHVPYRGGGPAVLGLLSGDVDVFISDLSTTVENIRGGRLKALAMAWPARSPFLPETPTFAELGYPAVVSSSWFGLAAPVSTPADIIDRLAQAMQQVFCVTRIPGRPQEARQRAVHVYSRAILGLHQGRGGQVGRRRQIRQHPSRLTSCSWLFRCMVLFGGGCRPLLWRDVEVA